MSTPNHTTTTTSILHTKLKKKLQTLLVFPFCLVFNLVQAQSVNESFKSLTDSLIKAAPTSYTAIHKVLRKYRSDTLSIRYFSQKSKENEYAAGQTAVLSMVKSVIPINFLRFVCGYSAQAFGLTS